MRSRSGAVDATTVSPIASPPEDRALIEAARAGDRRALDELLRVHQEKVHAIARRMTRNDADALDATQEALIAIVRGLPRFDFRSAFSTWVYRVATNACLDELRRRGRRPAPVPELADGALADPGPADSVADRLDIDAALGTVPEEFRAAVVLRDQLGLEYSEIAEVLQIPLGTVRSRIARGRSALSLALGGNRGRSGDVQADSHE